MSAGASLLLPFLAALRLGAIASLYSPRSWIWIGWIFLRSLRMRRCSRHCIIVSVESELTDESDEVTEYERRRCRRCRLRRPFPRWPRL